MKTVIFIPYSPAPLRQGPLEIVMRHLDQTPWKYKLATDPHVPFLFSVAVNRAIADSDAEIVVINSADTTVPMGQMLETVRLAQDEPGLVFGYTHYIRLDQHGKRQRALVNPASHSFAAIQRECWDQLGGYDEGYVGWGMEDRDLNRRVEKLWPIRRVPGELLHYWHGDRRPDDSTLETPPEQVAANWRRFKATA